jgi:hypothetical protein
VGAFFFSPFFEAAPKNDAPSVVEYWIMPLLLLSERLNRTGNMTAKKKTRDPYLNEWIYILSFD